MPGMSGISCPASVCWAKACAPATSHKAKSAQRIGILPSFVRLSGGARHESSFGAIDPITKPDRRRATFRGEAQSGAPSKLTSTRLARRPRVTAICAKRMTGNEREIKSEGIRGKPVSPLDLASGFYAFRQALWVVEFL